MSSIPSDHDTPTGADAPGSGAEWVRFFEFVAVGAPVPLVDPIDRAVYGFQYAATFSVDADAGRKGTNASPTAGL